METSELILPPVQEYKALVLQNTNNVLECESFLYLQEAPGRVITVDDLNVMYLVQHKGQELKLRQVQLFRWQFQWMSDLICYAAAGMSAYDWKKQWLEAHPDTRDETEIGIYIYKRCYKN